MPRLIRRVSAFACQPSVYLVSKGAVEYTRARWVGVYACNACHATHVLPFGRAYKTHTGRSNNPRILTRILTSSTKKKHSCLIELIDSIFVLIYTIQYSLFFNILTFDKTLIIVASKNLYPMIESLSIIFSPKISPQFSTPRAWNGK